MRMKGTLLFLLFSITIFIACAGVGGRPAVRSFKDHVETELFLEGMIQLLIEAGAERGKIDYALHGTASMAAKARALRPQAEKLSGIAESVKVSNPMVGGEALMALALFDRIAGKPALSRTRFLEAVKLYTRALRTRGLFRGVYGIVQKAECYRALAVCNRYLKRNRVAALNISRAISLIGNGSRFLRIKGERQRLFGSIFLERVANTMAAFFGADADAKKQPSRDYFRSGKVMESAATLAPISFSSAKFATLFRYRAARVWLKTGERYEDFAEAAVKLREKTSGVHFLKLAVRVYGRTLALSAKGKPGANPALARRAKEYRTRAGKRRRELGG